MAVGGTYGADPNRYTDSRATDHITGELERLHVWDRTMGTIKFIQLMVQVWIYIILVILFFIPRVMTCILIIFFMFLMPQKVFFLLVALLEIIMPLLNIGLTPFLLRIRT
jgi:hypothetical protein